MTNRTYSAADYPDIFTVPLPPKPKPGPTSGARCAKFVPYLEIARDMLAQGVYANAEQAAYQTAKRADETFDVDFDTLKSFLRYHLNK